MRGTHQQLVSLVTHANAAIRGLRFPAFFPDHPQSSHCESFRFVDVSDVHRSGLEGWEVAADPDAWFAELRRDRAERVLLRMRRATVPKGTPLDWSWSGSWNQGWALHVHTAAGDVEEWIHRWDLGRRDAPDGRIWRVTFGRTGSVPRPEPWPSVPVVRDALLGTIEDILAFARRNERWEFVETFERALSVLRHGAPPPPADVLAPAGALPEPADRLLATCWMLGIFGPGKKWMDEQEFGVERARDFVSVTMKLMRAVQASIAAAGNASAP